MIGVGASSALRQPNTMLRVINRLQVRKIQDALPQKVASTSQSHKLDKAKPALEDSESRSENQLREDGELCRLDQCLTADAIFDANFQGIVTGRQITRVKQTRQR